jgi:hypothetical protein
MVKIPSILVPGIVAVIAYLIVDKFFPEDIDYQKDFRSADLEAEKDLRSGEMDSEKDFRNGDIVRKSLIKKIFDKIMNDRAIKVGIVMLFFLAGAQHFNHEIETLLADDVFNKVCVKNVDGKLKIVCDIIKDNNLNFHSNSIKQLMVATNLSNEDKINLLKIKLDFIINGECAGKTKFMVLAIIGIIVGVCFSGITGLTIFLEALYRLFQEGRISRALYEQIVESVKSRWFKVPVEHLH